MNRDIGNGVWIRVSDLAAERRFFQTVFDLDFPVLENGEFCVFSLNDSDFFLVLEKSSAPYLEHVCSANSWFITVDDIDAVGEKLNRYGIDLFRNILEFGGYSFHRCCDLEGNVLVLGEKVR